MTRVFMVMSYVQTWVFGDLGEVGIILKWIIKKRISLYELANPS
jgi:hypothetical protein